MALIAGTVVWFNPQKGFGFLTTPGRPDVFCHFTAIMCDGFKTIHDGDEVEFEIVTGEKGRPQAANVRVVHPAGNVTRPVTAALPKPVSQYN